MKSKLLQPILWHSVEWMLTSQKPCQHNNKCVRSKTIGYNEVYVFFNKISQKRYFIEKNINFIYCVDKTFQVIIIMGFDRTGPRCYNTFFSLCQFWLIKWSFFIHRTTPYIHPRLDSRIEPKFSDWSGCFAFLCICD